MVCLLDDLYKSSRSKGEVQIESPLKDSYKMSEQDHEIYDIVKNLTSYMQQIKGQFGRWNRELDFSAQILEQKLRYTTNESCTQVSKNSNDYSRIYIFITAPVFCMIMMQSN
jgi:hypothetical protein